MRDNEILNFYRENSSGIPYYEEADKVINLDKTFFKLDEDQNNQPTLFYPGRNLNFQPSGVL